MKYYDIIYHCDASPEIGIGHLSRGINIMNAYIKKHPDSTLAIKGKFDNNIISFIEGNLNKNIQVLSPKSNSVCSVGIIDTMFYPGKQDINLEYIKSIKSNTNKLILLWDAIEIDVPNEVDIIINHLPYVQLFGNTKVKKYIGFDYMPVLSEYYNDFTYKQKDGDILSVFGSNTNPADILPFLTYLNGIVYDNKIRVLLSPSYQVSFLNELSKKFEDIEFLQNVESVFELIKDASAVITTYGNTTFQVLTAKVPVFNIAYQPFQNYYAQKLEDAGFSVNLGNFSNFSKNKFELVFDKKHKLEMHNKQKRVFKNPGIKNIINILAKELNMIGAN